MASEGDDGYLPLDSLLEVSLVEENSTSKHALQDIFLEVEEETESLEKTTKRTELPVLKTSEEEEQFYKELFQDISLVKYMRIHCTICECHIGCGPESIDIIFSHRILGVLVCKRCYMFYGEGYFPQDNDGTEIYCRWCGQGGKLICCSKCPSTFCKRCIARNFTKGVKADIESASEWLCFVCDPKNLWEHRALCWAVTTYTHKEQEDWKCGIESESPLYGPGRPTPGDTPIMCCEDRTYRRLVSGKPSEKKFMTYIQVGYRQRLVNLFYERDMMEKLNGNKPLAPIKFPGDENERNTITEISNSLEETNVLSSCSIPEPPMVQIPSDVASRMKFGSPNSASQQNQFQSISKEASGQHLFFYFDRNGVQHPVTPIPSSILKSALSNASNLVAGHTAKSPVVSSSRVIVHQSASFQEGGVVTVTDCEDPLDIGTSVSEVDPLDCSEVRVISSTIRQPPRPYSSYIQRRSLQQSGCLVKQVSQISSTVSDSSVPVKENTASGPNTNFPVRGTKKLCNATTASISEQDNLLQYKWLKTCLQDVDGISRNITSRILVMTKMYEVFVKNNDVSGLKLLVKKLHTLLNKAADKTSKVDTQLTEEFKKWENLSGNEEVVIVGETSNTKQKKENASNMSGDASSRGVSSNGPVGLDMEISCDSDQSSLDSFEKSIHMEVADWNSSDSEKRGYGKSSDKIAEEVTILETASNLERTSHTANNEDIANAHSENAVGKVQYVKKSLTVKKFAASSPDQIKKPRNCVTSSVLDNEDKVKSPPRSNGGLKRCKIEDDGAETCSAQKQCKSHLKSKSNWSQVVNPCSVYLKRLDEFQVTPRTGKRK